jgi:hypothetical protein
MMPRKLYPVYGHTGEYADRAQWVVGVFHMKRSADAAARLLNEAAAKHDVLYVGRATRIFLGDEKKEAAQEALRKAGDLIAAIDYTGVSYGVGTPIRQFVDLADFKMTGYR